MNPDAGRLPAHSYLGVRFAVIGVRVKFEKILRN